MDAVKFDEGAELLNRGEFFSAHEVLEDVWRAAPAAEKKFLQGVVQVAVALHHYSKGNLAGACSVLTRAHHNMAAAAPAGAGKDFTAFRSAVSAWCQALQNGAPPPPLPQL